MLSYLGLSNYLITILLVNLAIGAALLVSVRIFVGLATNVNSIEELAERDNPAFGITLAGTLLGVGIIGTGVISGDPAATIGHEVMILLAYGAAGLAAIMVSRQIFDRISMPDLDVHEELRQGKVAVALTDAGNALATALIVRSVINWVMGDDLTVAVIAFFGFLVSQMVSSIVTYYRISAYNQAHDDSFQKALQDGNTALALRFGGFQIGAALAITSALNLVPYDPAAPVHVLLYWLGLCAVLLILLFALGWLAGRLVLGSVDMRHEVDKERNVAIAVIQAAILVAIGFALSAATA
ncbi:MAG: DUF350 domain-containing protein [Alphaproteobacteria bacterium]